MKKALLLLGVLAAVAAVAKAQSGKLSYTPRTLPAPNSFKLKTDTGVSALTGKSTTNEHELLNRLLACNKPSPYHGLLPYNDVVYSTMPVAQLKTPAADSMPVAKPRYNTSYNMPVKRMAIVNPVKANPVIPEPVSEKN